MLNDRFISVRHTRRMRHSILISSFATDTFDCDAWDIADRDDIKLPFSNM